MIGSLRLVALVAAAGLVWLVLAAQVPGRTRLPIGAVVPGAVITQPFGCSSLDLEPFDPFCPGHHIHTGIDLAAPAGTAVHSVTEGTAHLGIDPTGAGFYVVVTVDAHARLFYCHLSKFAIGDGDQVRPGEVIGAVGSSGRATGPHVHFELQLNGASTDPARWLAS